MDSFYGGKPGSPFIIKASFKTVAEMKTEFCKGPAYKDVWFGEYCIIDAVSNNSYDNGKIYRRTFNYQDEAACAEYICKITGPEGGTPHFILSSIDSIQELVNQDDLFIPESPMRDEHNNVIDENPEPDTRMYPIEGENGSIEYYVDSDNDSNKHHSPAVLSLEVKNGTLIPGYFIDENDKEVFTDNIQYTWCSEKFSPYGEEYPGESRVHLGFKIPYIVPRFEVTTVPPQEHAGITEMTEEEEHPFSPKYALNIPRGSKPIDFQVGDNGEITFRYEHEENPEKRESGGIIPCIVGAEVREDDYHLWIGFSQPKNEEDEPGSDGAYWYDYGSVKDEDGILIGYRFESKSDLDNFIPDDSDGRVKTATVYRGENLPCKLYAWDYDEKTWYEIGSFDGDGLPQIMVGSEVDVSEMITSKKIKENGVCLVTTGFEPYDHPMDPTVDRGLIDNCYWWGVGKIQ